MQTKSKESNKTTCEVVIWSMTQEEKDLMEMLKEIDKALEEIYEFSMKNDILKMQKILSHLKVF